jgi:uncharacterized membrane protein YhaH (DUF805 family)
MPNNKLIFMTREKYNPEDDYNMFDWWKKAMIDNYANFKGRARRKEYWFSQLMNTVIITILYIPIIASAIETRNGGAPNALTYLFLILIVIYAFGFLVPGLALAVRRLHDIGKSGWFWFIGLIPFVGGIILLVQYCTDSQHGENQWGPNPKGIGNNDKLDQIGVSEE